MGRHVENELCVDSLATTLEDRYLIGYYKENPIVAIVNTITGIVGLQNGWRAIHDQVAINKAEGVEEKIACSSRKLLEKPIVYYGFTDQKSAMSREEEIVLRKRARELAKSMGSREIDRELYGDEVFCMVGKFQRGDKVYLEALGYVYKQNHETVKISQVLAEIPSDNSVKVNFIGAEGICGEISRKYDKRNYVEWLIAKQNIGVPVIEVRKGKKTVTFELDIKGTYQFKNRDKWEFDKSEDTD